MERQGLGMRGWGLGTLLAVAISFSSFGRAKAKPDNEKGAEVTITIRVFNYVRLPQNVIEDAGKEADKIFRKAGLESVWVDCQVSAEQVVKNPACKEPLGPAEFALRILPRSEAVPAFLRDNLGFAHLDAQARGSMAAIFYDRVVDLSEGGRASRAVVLAHASAHEVGHLLLRTSSHSLVGVMRGGWVQEDLRQAAMGSLLFTRQQAVLIRAEVMARQTYAQRPAGSEPPQAFESVAAR